MGSRRWVRDAFGRLTSCFRGKEESATRQNPVQEESVNRQTQTYQRHVIEHCDQSEQTGREQQKNSQQTGGEGSKRLKTMDQSDCLVTYQRHVIEQRYQSEQTGREQKKNSQQAEQTGGDQGDEDKERDQCEINQTPPGTIRIGLLNVHSMEKKTDNIKRLITANNLDAFLTTETWLKHDTAVTVLSEASPEGFRFHSQVRADGRRGGGVAIQFSEKLQEIPRIPFSYLNIETFEFVVTKLKRNDWDQPVVIINLYLPPGYNQELFHRFRKEFESLLDEVKDQYSSIIVTGDFNIHVNKESISNTKKLNKFLDTNDLTQHVEEPTHRGGNTLDLVITRNVEISDLIVRNDGVSDHYTVYFNAKPKDTKENENEEQTRFRKTEE